MLGGWRLIRHMAEETARHGVGTAIAELARAQHGVVAASQLRDLGLSPDQIHSRAAAGWLARLHRAVYAVGAQTLSWRGRWLGAVLACGDGALLSHRSGAALWRLTRPRRGHIHVTVPGHGGRGGHAGITLHRSTTLTDADRRQHDAIPVTSPERTIIDLARTGMRGRPLERILDEAEYLRLLSPSAFNAASQSRPLPRSLTSLLASHAPGTTRTRTDLEELFLGLCRDAGLPQPLINAPLLGLTVDCLWPAAALVVEVDGRASHGTRRGFEDDRDRDSMLAAAGFMTLRFTWRDVERRPAVVAHRLGRVLAARGR